MARFAGFTAVRRLWMTLNDRSPQMLRGMRIEDYSSCSYFYLDRTENGLAPLIPASERMKGL